MANLLPPDIREANRAEYRLRVAVVAGLSLLVALVVAASGLIPAYAYSLKKLRSYERQVSFLQTGTSTEVARLAEQTLLRAADDLRLAENQSGPVDLDQILDSIVESQGSTILLTRLAYEIKNDHSEILLSGTAPLREDLLAFKRRLERIEGVVAAVMPSQDLAQDSQISFHATLILKP
jgi:hypothetical protein